MKLDPRDVAHCRALLAAGSKSFDAASRALPRRLRDPVAVLYAFCRVSDDAVDESGDASAAQEALTLRLDGIYRGAPSEDPVDRALSSIVASHALPRAPLDALLEGYAWDAGERSYATLSELYGYCARVAASVGVAMTYLMGERDRSVLARAIDLGVAMQLTNIARDVGEDARRGRIYLPLQWIETRNVLQPEALRLDRSVRDATRRLLDDAEVLYARALLGVPHLPSDCRLAIRSAAYFYRAIGRRVRMAGDDGVTQRQSTSTLEKAALLSQALIDDRIAKAEPLRDPVLPEAAFLLR
jgi:phytoene synthase